MRRTGLVPEYKEGPRGHRIEVGAEWDDGSPTCDSPGHFSGAIATHTVSWPLPAISPTRRGTSVRCLACTEKFAKKYGCKPWLVRQ